MDKLVLIDGFVKWLLCLVLFDFLPTLLQYPVNSQVTTLLTLDTVSKNPDFYEIQNNTYNLIVKNATYKDDGTFECEAGTSKKTARVYVYGM